MFSLVAWFAVTFTFSSNLVYIYIGLLLPYLTIFHLLALCLNSGDSQIVCGVPPIHHLHLLKCLKVLRCTKLFVEIVLGQLKIQITSFQNSNHEFFTVLSLN
jgi:hypothetical protein